ncbi:MAG: transposase family protein [Blastococcus sp.]|jgi:transposase|nr:transposase family protein [Blastococcus sp.]
MTARANDSQVQIFGGVDTHHDTHTAAALDAAGAMLGSKQFPATAAGYTALLSWLRSLGSLVRVGIEGTSSYGAGLATVLRAAGVTVVEVDRPDRSTRRRYGKSDPLDAEAAARAVLAGRATGAAKTHDGVVECIRVLRIARSSARDQRADCIRRIKSLLVTAPEALRAQLRGLTDTKLVAICAALRPDHTDAGNPTTATKIAIRALARRHTELTGELADLDELIQPLVAQANPALLAVHGVGPEVAAQLLITVGDNPHRLHSEAAFAMLCGVAPLPASSGRTNRHRLNRGGDRQANNALWRIALCRMKTHAPTRDYVTRRTTEGLSKPEIIRCLKRYIARDLYGLLVPETTGNDLALAA